MRAFHMTWFAFFLCFFGWFGLAPLMPVIRQELHLTKEQIGNSIIASVAITVFARLLIGWLCDRVGPRRAYTWLLILGSLPVMGVGLAHDYTTFLLFRLAIGAIGASFVITQFHTSVMFAPEHRRHRQRHRRRLGQPRRRRHADGDAAAVRGFREPSARAPGGAGAWRWSCPGSCCFLTGIAYYFLTQDTADGDFRNCGRRGHADAPRPPEHSGKHAATAASGRWPCSTPPASAWN